MGKRTIHLFVFDGFSDGEPKHAIAQLRNMFAVRTVAAGGLRIAADLTLDQLRPADSALLILPDGPAWENGGNRDATRKAVEFLAAGIPVAAMGGAARSLARIGWRDDRNLAAAEGGAAGEWTRAILDVLRTGPRQPEPASDAGRSGQLRAMVWSDPAGVTDSPISRKIIVSMHMGAPVHIGCRRGGKYHCGLTVHGDIDVIPPDTPSRWELREKDTAFIMRLPVNLLSLAAEEAGVDPAQVEIVNRFQVRDAQMEHIGWALKAEMEADYRSGRLFLDSLGTALAACLLDRHSSASRATNTGPQGMSGRRLRQVLAHIEEHVGRDLPLKEIAGIAGVSVSHSNAAFRKAMGMPIHQYVIQRRVERAKTLLGEGRLSISQIAVETGFAHQSHLAYHVRRLLGVAPLSLWGNRSRSRQAASLTG